MQQKNLKQKRTRGTRNHISRLTDFYEYPSGGIRAVTSRQKMQQTRSLYSFQLRHNKGTDTVVCAWKIPLVKISCTCDTISGTGAREGGVAVALYGNLRNKHARYIADSHIIVINVIHHYRCFSSRGWRFWYPWMITQNIRHRQNMP